MAPVTEPMPTTATGGESPPSDNDSGERPVRKQLKETSIDSTHTNVNENASSRKRSFEESRDHHDDPCENGESRRKRSREGTPQSGNVSTNNMQNTLWIPLDIAQGNLSPSTLPSTTPGTPNHAPGLDDLLDYEEYEQNEDAIMPQGRDEPTDWCPLHDRLNDLNDYQTWLAKQHELYDRQEELFEKERKRLQDKAKFGAEQRKRLEEEQKDAEEARNELQATQDLLDESKRRLDKRQDRLRRKQDRLYEDHDRLVRIQAHFDEEYEILHELIDEIQREQPRVERRKSKVLLEQSRLEEKPKFLKEDQKSPSPSPKPPGAPKTHKAWPETSFPRANRSSRDCPGSPEPWVASLLPQNSYLYVPYSRSPKSKPTLQRELSAESVLEILLQKSPVDGDLLNVKFEDDPSTSSYKSTSVSSSGKEYSSPNPQTPPDTHKEIYETSTNPMLQDPKSSTIEPTLGNMDDESAKYPKKKRSHEQLEDASKKSDTTNDLAPTPAGPADANSTIGGEPEKKKHRDNSQERDTKTGNAFASSAFGKAAASPFASLNKIQDSTRDSPKPASASAFASSSLAAFAGSESSPFGALGGSTHSVFTPASGTSSFATPSLFSSAASGTNSFAAPSGTSGFGVLGSGFTGVGGGFGAAAKAGGLASFASSNAPATLGETKAKPLGANDSDADESDANDEENTHTFEASKTDERFYAQDSRFPQSLLLDCTNRAHLVQTGEEDEETVFSCKAKLFHFSNKEWKERGIGTFKVNVRQNDDGKPTGRMIMRADGAMRVMLNSPIFKGMNYGDAKNEAPINKQILLATLEEGRTVPLLLRTANESYARELYDTIDDLLKDADV
ncbi:hypothetical protein N7490_006885 [Penicillium lividum]|nr:hypothetical protein N7490_006885 [Penicillium lividum]